MTDQNNNISILIPFLYKEEVIIQDVKLGGYTFGSPMVKIPSLPLVIKQKDFRAMQNNLQIAMKNFIQLCDTQSRDVGGRKGNLRDV